MRVAATNWLQLEEYLRRDDRIVLPLGSTEQHAYLSLATDSILAERVAAEAAEPLGVPVLPVLAYGVVPRFVAYPGTLSLSEELYVALLRELVDGLRGQGFSRVLVVNGHGGNSFAAAHVAGEGVVWHDWWNSDAMRALIDRLEPDSAHASWMENFPWTRLPGVELPGGRKPPVELERLRGLDPRAVRELLGDGSFGGSYARPDEEVLELWRLGVEEVRRLLEAQSSAR